MPLRHAGIERGREDSPHCCTEQKMLHSAAYKLSEKEAKVMEIFNEIKAKSEKGELLVTSLLPEEAEAARRKRVRMAFSVGNLAGIIAGTVLILLLVALLLSMINFLQTDISRNFSLLQTKF